MPIAEEKLERIREATVLLILDLRAQYLANGASALTHWDQIATRMQSSIRQASTIDTWFSLMMRKLQIQAPSSNSAYSISALKTAVGSELMEWRRIVEKEAGALLAQARLAAEQRRADRDARLAGDVIGVQTEVA